MAVYPAPAPLGPEQVHLEFPSRQHQYRQNGIQEQIEQHTIYNDYIHIHTHQEILDTQRAKYGLVVLFSILFGTGLGMLFKSMGTCAR